MPGQDDDYDERDTYDDEREPLSPATVAKAALQDVAELTGKAPSGITALEPDDDGWMVEIEVVEERRVPSSGDILAVYRAKLDADANLTGLRRIRRYPRGKGDIEAA
ncbi:gas vesicle protein [Dactylosporangium sp. CA-233914]|uniref:gas vesicle protein GvpO n=1 Tax=Dactylosporangium sp. CA-233914 TaxID=3239934 RepID=UPI003D93E409